MSKLSFEWMTAGMKTWTRDQWMVTGLYALMYTGIIVGLLLVMCMKHSGFLIIGASVAFTVLIFWIVKLDYRSGRKNDDRPSAPD